MSNEEVESIQIPYLSDDDVKKLVWVIHMNVQGILKRIQEDEVGTIQTEVQKS